MHQQQTASEKIVGKREIARNEQFLLFPHCFQLNQITVSPFFHIFDILILCPVSLEEPKIGISGLKVQSLNIFILHRLRNKFLQLILIR